METTKVPLALATVTRLRTPTTSQALTAVRRRELSPLTKATLPQLARTMRQWTPTLQQSRRLPRLVPRCTLMRTSSLMVPSSLRKCCRVSLRAQHADLVVPDSVDGKNGAVAEARLKGFSDDLILACASKLSLQVDYDPPTNNGTAPQQKQNKRSEQPLPESYWKCLSDTQAKAQGTHAKLQQGSKAKAAGTVTDGKTDCDDPKKKEEEPKEAAKPADKVGKRAIPYGSRRVLSDRA
ncbi:hypothetical protein IE81DRAFT_115560 [Ceraceosorus guamensis]|uniref:Uncharacterized protein n=1 Tax=Ceraceosorus guamensis TaxID=1522189 RepID=A0A316W581_9BASI|nr:hypothetical protein IE81DRAFT_115560 [Ceraceosorus guamensis]PWN42785.1 hypothetical protein IE81DRAFT_115560 [Ceraceosorus guamensis]